MTRFLFSFISSFIFLFSISCTQTAEKDPGTGENTPKFIFGDSISEDGAIESIALLKTMGSTDSLNIKVHGKITDVCQKKGCWMEMEIGEGKTMRISFKDYSFFVPIDAGGKTAFIDGYAKRDTISVLDLKHFASDAGKSAEEIEKITSPEVEITYEARGVIIIDK